MQTLLVMSLLAIAAWCRQPETPRDLPPTEAYPRSRAEYVQYEAQKQAMRAHENGAGREALLEVAKQRMRDWEPRFLLPERAYDVPLADELFDELYMDLGDPALNAAFQDALVDGVLVPLSHASAERLPRAARRHVARSLAQYLDQGGGQWGPSSLASAAHALSRACDGDPALLTQAERSLAEALSWTDDLGDAIDPFVSNQVYRACEAHWGPDYVFQGYLRGGAVAIPELPDKPPAEYHRARAAIENALPGAAIAQEPRGDWPRRLERAVTLSAVPLDSAALEHDLTARLLLLLRSVAVWRDTPGEVVAFVDRVLVELPRRNRLALPLHWSLWERAVLAVGPRRASDRLREFLSRAAAGREDSPQRQTAQRLLAALESAQPRDSGRP
ncbi:MAG TPA: hypothetical protein PKC49_01730 [Phycisphaerae bacterium]|nr:hypothetical protein [Phycisphaerae bacterium]